MCNLSLLTILQLTILHALQFCVRAGKSKDEAMTDYITKVKQLLEEAAASTS